MEHINTLLATSLICAATVRADDGELARKAEAVHGVLWSKFIFPGTDLVRTRVKRGSGLEDTSLYGGIYLAAMVDRYEVTKSPDDPEKARRLFGGLVLNATCAEPGFIARGLRPDGKGFLGNPSVDQYTGLLYGLWRFYGSEISSSAEKQKVREIYAACLKRLERDDFTIMDSDGKTPTKFCHLSSKKPTRSERLLSFLLVGAKLTGDEHWFDVYEEMREPRLETCRAFPDYNAWVLIQSALSLDMLIATEDRADVRKVYEEGFGSCVNHCLKQIPAYREYLREYDGRESKEMVKKFRNPVEAIAVVLLSGDKQAGQQTVKPLKEILLGIDPAKIDTSVPLCSLEWDYWLAVKQGLIKRAN